MAIYHFSVDVIQRSKGESSVAASAYRAGEKITDERTGEIHDYTKKENCDYNEILLPDNAPEAYADRGALWNAVEKKERRGDAQVCRSIDMALPNKMPEKLQEHLLREFCQEQFVEYGMAADLSIHRPTRTQKNDHAHVLLTMRELDESGFGNKVRSWNDKALVDQWREAWANKVNEYIDRFHINESHIDHRSLEEQGIDRTPQVHMGKAATAMERKGQLTDRGNFNREIKVLDEEVAKLQKIAENAIGITTRQQELLQNNTLNADDVQMHMDLLQHSRSIFDAIIESELLETSTSNSLLGDMNETSDEVALRLEFLAKQFKTPLRASESLTDGRKPDIGYIIANGYKIQQEQNAELDARYKEQEKRIRDQSERELKEEMRLIALRIKKEKAMYQTWKPTKKKKPYPAIGLYDENGRRRSLLEHILIFAILVINKEVPDFLKPESEWKLMEEEQRTIVEVAVFRVKQFKTAINCALEEEWETYDDLERIIKDKNAHPDKISKAEMVREQLIHAMNKEYCQCTDVAQREKIPSKSEELKR